MRTYQVKNTLTGERQFFHIDDDGGYHVTLDKHIWCSTFLERHQIARYLSDFHRQPNTYTIREVK